MDPLRIEPTPSTPLIDFNPANGSFVMNGRSTPEHPSEFYSKVSSWVEQYVNGPTQHTVVEIFFEYFNTSSSKYILEMLKKLVAVSSTGKSIEFKWYYENEDDDMREAGIDFKELLGMPFEFIEKEQAQ